ncbi:cytochrome c oxidase assembly protein [Paracoccus sp. Z118]|uniref:cytochrome c oxidase assembly protein n=1 Tax=Paracoccus sp. Z118 TaxID=2851017 RepID=UPI001C2C8EE0|nr:cytochrome c oxidase assembly protein [Paracoccus sp. Z118]MBV0890546.1 cytochrome c oxidase assembly protein [Paracoccus sp. Z118]
MNPNTRVVIRLVSVVLIMGALGWAAVPFYSWFCRVTGFAGTTSVAEAESDVVLDELVRVRFDSNIAPNLDWTFRPMQREMTMKIGETGLAFYEAVNNSDETIIGTATYNVSPDSAGYYFEKLDCFCFTEQELKPGERVEMPITFFVDPGIVTDRDAKKVRDITLSYTFFRKDEPVRRSASATTAPAPAPSVN